MHRQPGILGVQFWYNLPKSYCGPDSLYYSDIDIGTSDLNADGKTVRALERQHREDIERRHAQSRIPHS